MKPHSAKPKAFTLIELLVVISIIAVLMAILMPALRRVRAQARAVICQSHLKQWGSIWSMYQNDFANVLPPGLPGVWVEPLRLYYGVAGEEIRTCPTATKSWEEGGLSWFTAWDIVHRDAPEESFRGSYGINNWCYNPTGATLWGHDTTLHWRRSDVKGNSRIPLFLDAYRWGGHPDDSDRAAPSIPILESDYQGRNGMNRFLLNRHHGFSNILFLDFSVRKTSLKSFWTLKWHREFDISGYGDPWPDWMTSLPQ
ncbi:MAG: type II secretion system protein [Planctomycetes bacterium]|nr:type II secretion system protein [Planctomycetota bacterium]